MATKTKQEPRAKVLLWEGTVRDDGTRLVVWDRASETRGDDTFNLAQRIREGSLIYGVSRNLFLSSKRWDDLPKPQEIAGSLADKLGFDYVLLEVLYPNQGLSPNPNVDEYRLNFYVEGHRRSS